LRLPAAGARGQRAEQDEREGEGCIATVHGAFPLHLAIASAGPREPRGVIVATHEK
jgi:hypothetical protein